MASGAEMILIEGGLVYDHDGDPHLPARADILIEGARIARVGPGLAAAPEARDAGRVVDARDRLVVPGFVNAHYHSHDVLLKGCFETEPLEVWVLGALPPAYPKRSTEEVRARTLLGAAECIHGGMTTVQDMLTVFPPDPDHVDAALAAYTEIGIRVVFALQIGDIPGIERVPFWAETVPPEHHRHLGASVEPFAGVDPVDAVLAEYRRARGGNARIGWGLAPTSPEFCSPGLLERLAAESRAHDLPVFTHIYESRSMALAGRRYMPEHGGSQLRYLDAVGLLGPRLCLAHAVWMLPEEIARIAEAGASVAACPAGNLKTKSGVAPIREYLAAGVNVALGCDNSSCGDAQNMFQAMKLFAGLAAVSDPEPGPPSAADTIRCATLGGAAAAGLAGTVGAIRPGMKADLTLLDLAGLPLVPLNSAARQLVFAESGASIDMVLIDGRVVLEDRRLTMIDEDELRASVEVVMHGLRDDVARVQRRLRTLYPHLLAAWRKSWGEEVGLDRYVGRG